MATQLVGETAALVVSVLWTACSIFFSSAGKRIGALSVNTIRISFAVVFLALGHIVVLGYFLPMATGAQWFWMGLSGVVGLALGDIGYIGALVLIGPRRGVLLMSTAPIFSVVTAAIFLDEWLGAWDLIGIAVTLAGVMLAILDEEDDGSVKGISRKKMYYGYTLALLGSVGQGVGLVISKYGMEQVEPGAALDPLSATLMRIVVAAAAMWLGVLVFGRFKDISKATEDKGAIARTFAGSVVGPFLGVWMSMVAISYALTGVASTLMSLMPIMVIPVVYYLYGQKTSWRGVAGAAIAIVGVALLFLF